MCVITILQPAKPVAEPTASCSWTVLPRWVISAGAKWSSTYGTETRKCGEATKHAYLRSLWYLSIDMTNRDVRRTAGIGMEDPNSPRNLIENHPHTLCQKKIQSGADAAQPTNLVPIVNAREICRAIDSQGRETGDQFIWFCICRLGMSPRLVLGSSVRPPIRCCLVGSSCYSFLSPVCLSFCARGRTQDRDQTLKDLYPCPRPAL